MSAIVFDLGDLKLPPSFITSGTTILGQPESGKTNTCRRVAEQALKHRVPVVIIDRKGDFWGLRLNPDGTPTGWDIAIFGGEHGDLELTEESGRAVADAIVENHASAILDLSNFESDAAAARFVTAFSKRLLFLKKDDPYPLLVILDEADLYAPKVVAGGAAAMVHAVLNLRKLGRKRGIGVLANAQRSSRLHQDLIDMADLLIMTQSAGRRDQATLRETLKDQMTGPELSELLRSVSRLQKGQAFAYSPSKFDLLGVVNIAKAESFDSSATPEFGAAYAQVKLGRIDIASLRETIAKDGIDLSKADLDELKAEITKLRAHKCALVTETVPVEKIVEVPIITEDDRAKIVALTDALRDLGVLTTKAHIETDKRFMEFIVSINERLPAGKFIERYDDQAIARISYEAAPERPQKSTEVRTSSPSAPRPAAQSERQNGLSKAETAILTVLAQHGTSTIQFVAIRAGYTAEGGGFRNALSSLRTKGYILKGDPIEPTAEGISALGDYEPLPTGAALREYWYAKLGLAERRCLEALCGAYPKGLTPEQIAEQAGYEASGGGFRNALGRLRTLQLAEGRNPVRASDSLF